VVHFTSEEIFLLNHCLSEISGLQIAVTSASLTNLLEVIKVIEKYLLKKNIKKSIKRKSLITGSFM